MFRMLDKVDRPSTACMVRAITRVMHGRGAFLCNHAIFNPSTLPPSTLYTSAALSSALAFFVAARARRTASASSSAQRRLPPVCCARARRLGHEGRRTSSASGAPTGQHPHPTTWLAVVETGSAVLVQCHSVSISVYIQVIHLGVYMQYGLRRDLVRRPCEE